MNNLDLYANFIKINIIIYRAQHVQHNDDNTIASDPCPPNDVGQRISFASIDIIVDSFCNDFIFIFIKNTYYYSNLTSKYEKIMLFNFL